MGPLEAWFIPEQLLSAPAPCPSSPTPVNSSSSCPETLCPLLAPLLYSNSGPVLFHMPPIIQHKPPAVTHVMDGTCFVFLVELLFEHRHISTQHFCGISAPTPTFLFHLHFASGNNISGKEMCHKSLSSLIEILKYK